METSRLFMPLLTELGGFEDGLCYKQVAPDGARVSVSAFQRNQLTTRRHLYFRWMRSGCCSRGVSPAR
jgi:hypothetical protein